VSPSPSPSLPRTDEALHRLNAALDRLEKAVADRLAVGDALLAEELRATREDYARLEDTTAMVSQRLDDTVERLRFLLGD